MSRCGKLYPNEHHAHKFHQAELQNFQLQFVDETRTDTNVSTIRFYLWTRDNSGDDDFDELFVDEGGESILGSRYDGGKKTKGKLIHEFCLH